MTIKLTKADYLSYMVDVKGYDEDTALEYYKEAGHVIDDILDGRERTECRQYANK